MTSLNAHYKHLESLKLDLGCGPHPKKDFIGIDSFVGQRAYDLDSESIDKLKLSVIQHDIEECIPFESDSVDEIVTGHFLEHCARLDRVFDEVHRVLKDNRVFEIIVPYATSAEGMFPGHSIFFTEDWFLKNLQFNTLFNIEEIIFYESEHYARRKEKLTKIFSFDEARVFLFNVCYQMQIISKCVKNNALRDARNIQYKVVPFALSGKPVLKEYLIGKLKRILRKRF